MTARLHDRARRIRERALVLAWEYRQRHHSKGVWFRFRRALVDADEAWSLNADDADCLEREGCVPLPLGQELEPPKRLLFVTRERLAGLPSRCRVPLRLCPELLAAENLALVRFT